MAKPKLGREAALRAPFLLAAGRAVGLCLYGQARLRFQASDLPGLRPADRGSA